jgi:hypothetical protein
MRKPADSSHGRLPAVLPERMLMPAAYAATNACDMLRLASSTGIGPAVVVATISSRRANAGHAIWRNAVAVAGAAPRHRGAKV